jgi:hypothetical protein
METLLVTVEASPLASAMRTSLFLYPLANVIHVLAALVFFSAVAAMDIKLLRASSIGEARVFIARIRPWAALALVVQIASGMLLFAPEATHVWMNPVFRVKLILVAIALLNVVAVEALIRRGDGRTAPAGAARGSAVVSLGLWLSVAATGRLIAYF